MTFGTVPGYGSQPAQPRPNSLSIVAMVVALTGIVSGIGFPVGAILGHVALKQVRERGDQGEGYAKAAVIVGWIGTILVGLLVAVLLTLFAQALGEVS